MMRLVCLLLALLIVGGVAEERVALLLVGEERGFGEPHSPTFDSIVQYVVQPLIEDDVTRKIDMYLCFKGNRDRKALDKSTNRTLDKLQALELGTRVSFKFDTDPIFTHFGTWGMQQGATMSHIYIYHMSTALTLL